MRIKSAMVDTIKSAMVDTTDLALSDVSRSMMFALRERGSIQRLRVCSLDCGCDARHLQRTLTGLADYNCSATAGSLPVSPHNHPITTLTRACTEQWTAPRK